MSAVPATPTPTPAEPEELLELEVVGVGDEEFYIHVGDVIAGKYRIEQLLGFGGMAFVYSAIHIELGERFALKFLSQRFLSQPTVIERFTQEARAACRLRSPHVARVYDVGVHVGAPYLVMEHLRGRDLAAILLEGGPLTIERAAEYAMQACAALAIAHRNGIVHRDIKPENLFLVEHEGLPVIKLLDFGISKVALSGDAPMTRLTGELSLGTPCYMSPEQIRNAASTDPRSDIWSLGVVLYELLAGTEPFRAESVPELCSAVLENEAAPLATLRHDVPEELAEIVARCMEKEPANRYADVAELAAALLPFAPSRALALAEQSSSLLRAAKVADGDDVPVPSARSRLRVPSRTSGIEVAPDSSASVACSIVPPVRRPRRRWIPISLALIAISGLAVAARLARSTLHAGDETPALAGAHEVPPSPPPEVASTPIAVRAAPTADEPASATTPTMALPTAAIAPVPTPAAAPVVPVVPARKPVASAGAPVLIKALSPSPKPSSPTPVKADAVATSAAAAATVELGY